MTDREFSSYTAANRQAWNEAMSRQQAANGSRWDDAFADPDFLALTDNELPLLQRFDVAGKSVAHVCCNNGVELMSLKRLGAGRCVGFDISDEAVKEAQERAIRLSIDCTFVRTDVYEIPAEYDAQFDVVYVSIGCFGWMPNLNAFMDRVAALLKPGGIVFIHEKHPFSEMLPNDRYNPDKDPLTIIEPYFKPEPYVDNDGIDYVGNTIYESATTYWFVWTLSDVIMSLVENGLNVEHFSEYGEDISCSHSRNEEAGIAIPLSYILVARKS